MAPGHELRVIDGKGKHFSIVSGLESLASTNNSDELKVGLRKNLLECGFVLLLLEIPPANSGQSQQRVGLQFGQG